LLLVIKYTIKELIASNIKKICIKIKIPPKLFPLLENKISSLKKIKSRLK